MRLVQASRSAPRIARSASAIGANLGKRFNPQAKHYEPFLVTEAPDLPKKLRVRKGAQTDR
jgi:hypothetical protein